MLETGVPPIGYLKRLRMARAAELLRNSDARLSEIAPAVGYGSEFSFSRAFKRHFGVAPGRFRSENMENGAAGRMRMAA